jgi:hypothetical protein
MIMIRAGLIVSLLLAGCGGGGGGTDGTSPSGAPGPSGVEQIDAAMRGIMSAHAPPGLAVAVVTNTSRDGRFFSDLRSSLLGAVKDIDQWPEQDLFPVWSSTPAAGH